MEVRDLNIPDERLVYLGSEEGSAFFWIGKMDTLPEEYADFTVVGSYPRTVGYQGEIVIVEGTKKGTLWNWNEFDVTQPEYVSPCEITREGVEKLIIAMARDAGRDYMNNLNQALRKMKKKRSSEQVNRMIRRVRDLSSKKIMMLEGTRVGEYILERIEDEIRAKSRCEQWDSMSYDKKNRYLLKETKQIRMDRIKDGEDVLYASIRGKSVKHGKRSSKRS